MRRVTSGVILLSAMLAILSISCGSDSSVEPSHSYVDDWEGEYSGSADFLLSNGRIGSSAEATLVIQRVGAAEVSVGAIVTYTPLGSTRDDEAYAFGVITPAAPDSIREEVKYGSQRVVIVMTQSAAGITAEITTSSRRYDGGWVVEQRLEIQAN